MIAPGGDAPMVMGVLWGLTGLTFFFVLLRLYTRLMVLQAYGLDDHFFNFAFVLFLVYDIMLTLASHYGFGRNTTDLTSTDDITHAILYEAIGQTILVFGTVVSKTSLALFLLRLVVKRSHKIAILVPVIILALFVVVSLFVFWFSCKPIEFLWNRFIPGGHCPIDPGPISTAAGVWSVVVDFWYAAVPWIVIWDVQMPPREKLLINLSMSLGVIAGACGIKRAMELKFLSSTNFLKDTVGLIIWHAAELSVTMVCIGIPVCRPLYKNWMKKMSSYVGSKQSGGYAKGDSREAFSLNTIGGTKARRERTKGSKSGLGEFEDTSATTTTMTMAKDGDVDVKHPHSGARMYADDASEDSILGLEYRHGQNVVDVRSTQDEDEARVHQSIWVKSEVQVESKARD